MAERVRFWFAGRLVEVDVDERAVAAELRSRTEGFEAGAEGAAWLRVRALGLAEPRATERLALRHLGGGRFELDGRLVSGELDSASTPAEARIAAQGPLPLCQGIFACASVMLPREGAMLLHADTVERGGRALALIGQSGAGKSTGARALLRDPAARRLAVDRTVVVGAANGRRPRIAAVPRMQRDEPSWGPPREVEIGALLVPRHGRDASLRPLRPSEAVASVLGATILPQGTGLPWEAGLELAAALLERVPVVELAFEPGADLSRVLEEAGYW